MAADPQPRANFDNNPANGDRGIRLETGDGIIHWVTRAEAIDLAWSLGNAIEDWETADMCSEASCGLTEA